MPHSLWTIVLAGGSGRRLAGVTGGVPKQFWPARAGRSLLEETLGRVAPLTRDDRTVVVVGANHREYVQANARAAALHHMLYQPADRGTAAGVLLGLMPVLEQSPDGVVLLTPSDHGVTDTSRFRSGIREAAAHVRSRAATIALFGAEPDSPEGEYGWVTPLEATSSPQPSPLRRVAAFVEKPPVERAVQLFAAGAVWNTMVLVARTDALFDLCRRQVPHLAEVFANALRLPPPSRETFLAESYPHLPVTDFSQAVLTPAQDLSLYTWPAAMGWSDLGTPERLQRWLGPIPSRRPLRAGRTRDGAGRAGQHVAWIRGRSAS